MSVSDPALGPSDASLGPIGTDPPELDVGGTSDAVLEIAARDADGWHAPADPARLRLLSRRIDEICDQVGRERPLGKADQVFLAEVGLARARESIDRFAAAGASTVTFILHTERGPDAVRRLGEALRLS